MDLVRQRGKAHILLLLWGEGEKEGGRREAGREGGGGRRGEEERELGRAGLRRRKRCHKGLIESR